MKDKTYFRDCALVYVGLAAVCAILFFGTQESRRVSMATGYIVLPWEKYTTPKLSVVSKLDMHAARQLIVNGQLIGMTRADVIKLLGMPSQGASENDGWMRFTIGPGYDLELSFSDNIVTGTKLLDTAA